MTNKLSHVDSDGNVNMVDVGQKQVSKRQAVAEALIHMNDRAFTAVVNDEIKKGNVIATAKLAGIMAAKNTAAMIPLCHQIQLTAIDVMIKPVMSDKSFHVTATVKCTEATGVEMEALTAVSVTCLTIYDMVKAIDKAMVIDQIRLVTKQGGKSGNYQSLTDCSGRS